LLEKLHEIELHKAYKRELQTFREQNNKNYYSTSYIVGILKIWYRYKTDESTPKYSTKWHDLARKVRDIDDTTHFKY
jgi:hypothetical protein